MVNLLSRLLFCFQDIGVISKVRPLSQNDDKTLLQDQITFAPSIIV